MPGCSSRSRAGHRWWYSRNRSAFYLLLRQRLLLESKAGKTLDPATALMKAAATRRLCNPRVASGTGGLDRGKTEFDHARLVDCCPEPCVRPDLPHDVPARAQNSRKLRFRTLSRKTRLHLEHGPASIIDGIARYV